MQHPLTTLMKLDPKMSDHLKRIDEFVFSNGVLPRKMKLLIAMAFDASHGAVNGVKALADAALKEGATKEEIAEVLRVAFHLGGVGSLYTASQGLKDLFE